MEGVANTLLSIENKTNNRKQTNAEKKKQIVKNDGRIGRQLLRMEKMEEKVMAKEIEKCGGTTREGENREQGRGRKRRKMEKAEGKAEGG